MNRRITYIGTLFYHDGIQVFEGRDSIGGSYVGVMVGDSSEGISQYIIVGASPARLQEFRLGKRDLGSLMRDRPESEWLIGSFPNDSSSSADIVADIRSGDVPSEYFPEDGFLLSIAPEVNVEWVKNESEARNSLALEVVLESEAPAQEHRIRADILSGALFSIQNLVKHAYRKIVTKDNARELGINREAAPILDVAVPAAAGSFRMLLIPSNEYPNLFNASEVGRALEVVDYLLADAPNPEKTLRRVQEYSGHTASAFLRFLKFVNDSGSAISYSWAAPDRSGVSVRMLSHQDMLPLIDIMSKTENLGSEKMTLAGRLRKIDVDAGTWRLFSSEDGKEYSGKIRAGISLSHLETDENYVFECEEEVEEVSGTGRETIVIYLVKQPQMPRRH